MGKKKVHKKKAYGSTKILDEKYDEVIRELRKVCRQETTVEEVAEKFNVSRASFFNWLKRKGLSITQICSDMKKELEEKAERKVKRKDLRKAPPKDFKEFLSFEIVRKVADSMKIANLSESHIKRTLRTWFKICQFTSKHPEYLNEEDVMAYLTHRKEQGNEINNLISMIQTIEKWSGKKLLPSGVEQSEYKGKYTTAELNQEARKLFLEYAKQLYPKDYDLIEATVKFLFYTGSRREALTNFSVAGELKLDLKEYETNEFIIVKTREKGKKGRKIEWNKIVPKHEFKLRCPLSQGELKKLERQFKAILSKMLQEHKELFNKDTVEYIRKGKVFHLWRHTSARSALKAFRWNRYIVAKLLGWEKTDNLRIYGDFGALELLQEYVKEPPKFKF